MYEDTEGSGKSAQTVSANGVAVEGAAGPAVTTRSFSTSSVASGDEIDVTISNVGLADGFGSVEETLPAGYSYVASSATSTTPNAAIEAEVSDQTVTFTLVAVDSFMYKVTVGSDVGDGQHTFSGVLKKLSGDQAIGGDATITVGDDTTTPPPDTTTPPIGSVSRSLPAGPVSPDDELTVTISNVGLADGFGEVVETLPSGFSYVTDSAMSTTANAAISGDDSVSGEVTFTLVAVDSFTYKVTVGSNVGDGQHTFSGVLEKLSGTETIGGDTTIMVGADTTTTPPDTTTPGAVSRSLPAGPMSPDDEFTVTINNVGLADGIRGGGGNTARRFQLCRELCHQHYCQCSYKW